MTKTAAAPTMPKSNKPKRDDKAVKISRDLATKAKLIAETNGITIAEYLSGILRPFIERDWAKALKKLNHSQSNPPADTE